MVILAAGLNGCAAVRQQLGTALIPPRTEMELGARMADQISQMQTLHPDPALQKYVREVAAPLASLSQEDRPGMNYVITVLDDESPGANFADWKPSGGGLQLSRRKVTGKVVG